MDNKNIVSILSKSIVHFQDQAELREIIENSLGCDLYRNEGSWKVTNRADQTPPTTAGIVFLMMLEGRVFHSLADIMVILIDILTEQLEIAEDRLKLHEWIPVSERLPEPGTTVNVYSTCPILGFLGVDCIDCDNGLWVSHQDQYEYYGSLAKEGITHSGPSKKAPYTHWAIISSMPNGPTFTESPEEGDE